MFIKKTSKLWVGRSNRPERANKKSHHEGGFSYWPNAVYF
jgi:hypothetical protein